MIRAALLFLATALPAFAGGEDWPAVLYVQGVAADDVLNIRAEPDADSQAVGALAPDARGIEGIAVSEDGTWVLVSTAGATGWASARYLGRDGVSAYGQLPRVSSCYGTEPFWNLTQTGPESFRFSTPGGTGPQIAFDWTDTIPGHWGQFAFRIGPFVGTMTREICSDGMSDRLFGLEVTLIDAEAGQAWSGCCSLSGN